MMGRFKIFLEDNRERAMRLLHTLDQLTTKRGASPAEAENAAKRAAEIRAKYGIASGTSTNPHQTKSRAYQDDWDDFLKRAAAHEWARQAQRKAAEAERAKRMSEAERHRREQEKYKADAYAKAKAAGWKPKDGKYNHKKSSDWPWTQDPKQSHRKHEEDFPWFKRPV